MNNTTLKFYFAQERWDEDWVWLIKNRIGPWVNQKGNSGYWDCVNIFSQYKGFLKSGLIRKDFAELIVAIRPDGLKEGKTKEQLKNSMDQCPVTLKLKEIGNYEENSERGKIIQELEQLFDTRIPATQQEESAPTIESRMEEFLEKRIATEKYVRMYHGKTYCGYTSTLSIEKYTSEQFMHQEIPSFIIVFECVNGKVSDDTVSLMAGRYGTDRRIKTVIASPSGIDNRVKSQAINNNVGLIRINPQYEVSEKDIITPRMERGCSTESYEYKMLSGQASMTVPLVIMDGLNTTTSLTSFLYNNGIPVNTPTKVHVPLIPHTVIEDVVSQIIKDDLEKYVAQLKECGVNGKVPYCAIDPYEYAGKARLMTCRSDLSQDSHLGRIDLERRRVWLSNKFKEGDICDRFSMAHEYGHYILHTHHAFSEFHKRFAELKAEAAIDISENHWLEIQANAFAANMLMPRELVARLYNIYWHKRFQRDQVEPLYVKAPIYQDRDFLNVAGPIARHLKVSLEAICYRLQNLGLMLDIIESNIEKVG